MSRLPILAVVFGLFASGCGSDSSSPAAAPSTTAPPTRIVMTATLSPAQEVPPVTNAESTASGTVTVTMNMTRDSAGNITAATVDFLANLTGFQPGTALSAAHIHNGVQGCACPVVVNTSIAAGEVSFPSGSGTLNKTGINVTPVDTATLIFNNPSGFYFNVHTALNPGGAARGQLSRTQ